jgi:hypothetical protein
MNEGFAGAAVTAIDNMASCENGIFRLVDPARI